MSSFIRARKLRFLSRMLDSLEVFAVSGVIGLEAGVLTAVDAILVENWGWSKAGVRSLQTSVGLSPDAICRVDEDMDGSKQIQGADRGVDE